MITQHAACAVVRDATGRVLALQQKHGFVLPGGAIAPRESARAAAAREVREETGLDVMLHPVPAFATRSTVFYVALAYTGALRNGGEGMPVWATWAHLVAHPRHGAVAQRLAQQLGVRA